ncbi:MAG: hypothetical protein IJV20_10255 [Prevotella sp.]|nr:hypothetical protein [Prevotella sp.]
MMWHDIESSGLKYWSRPSLMTVIPSVCLAGSPQALTSTIVCPFSLFSLRLTPFALTPLIFCLTTPCLVLSSSAWNTTS